jgi:8-oxo-dGTP diphosphatase
MGDVNLTYDKQAISVDCVIFGFDGKSLRVLLKQRQRELPSGEVLVDSKLPGSLISDSEDLTCAAQRVVQTLIGLRNINLRQMEIFSDPQRVQGNELEWINKYYGITLSRVVTMVFFTLVKLDSKLIAYTERREADWVELNDVRHLAFDHNKILIAAIDRLITLFRQEPVAFDFLPRKFTLRHLQNLYEAVYDIAIDNRNFRKKMLSLPYIVPSGESEKEVSHKPAQYYYFDRRKYRQKNNKIFKLGFIY